MTAGSGSWISTSSNCWSASPTVINKWRYNYKIFIIYRVLPFSTSWVRFCTGLLLPLPFPVTLATPLTPPVPLPSPPTCLTPPPLTPRAWWALWPLPALFWCAPNTGTWGGDGSSSESNLINTGIFIFEWVEQLLCKYILPASTWYRGLRTTCLPDLKNNDILQLQI